MWSYSCAFNLQLILTIRLETYGLVIKLLSNKATMVIDIQKCYNNYVVNWNLIGKGRNE